MSRRRDSNKSSSNAAGRTKKSGNDSGLGALSIARLPSPKTQGDEELAPRNQQTQTLFSIFRSELDSDFALRACILGNGGVNLRNIWEATRARVVFCQTPEGNPQDGSGACSDEVAAQLRIVGGKGADLSAAAARVQQLLELVRARQSKVGNFELAVDPTFPLRTCILGAHGQNLRRIRECTGVHVVLERCDHDGKTQFRIKPGRAVDVSDVSSAKAMIRDLIETARKSNDAWQKVGQKPGLDSPPPPPAGTGEGRRRREQQAKRAPRVAVDRVGDFCALFPLGACPFEACACPRGVHGEPARPAEDKVLIRITQAKKRLLQQKWTDAGGRGQLADAWQVRNPRLEFLFRASECDFAEALGHSSDIIDGWHGTAEENVESIAVNGFDPNRRSGQLYGSGEYFAKDPTVSVGYARGGSFLFLCKLLLGQEGADHAWVDACSYYVVKQRDSRVQALPLFLVQFEESSGDLSRRLSGLGVCDVELDGHLAERQRGGLRPCEARRDACMEAAATSHLWLGWLAPELCQQDNEAVAEDVRAFLHGYLVKEVIPERNGARIGAFVLLASSIRKADYNNLCRRRYRGEYSISVDDQQPCNPACQGKVCPRLTGPSHYCRGWNLRGHHAWQWGCPFDHPAARSPTYSAKYALEEIRRGTAKFDEIETELMRSAPFVSSDSTAHPRIVAVKRVLNKTLASLYEARRAFLQDKHGYTMEKELWHGTSCKALPELLTHGLQPPSDTAPAHGCPRSGGKGLCTTLCGTDCEHCQAAHCWDRCHMYGLGVYMADQAQKSHRYVREPAGEAIPVQAATWQTVLAGRWRDFDTKQQHEFETAMQSGHAVYNFSARGWPYSLDVSRMVQINLTTHRERPVRRVEADVAMAGDDGTGEARAATHERKVYSMLRCRVVLGSPYLIEGNLMQSDAMHDMCWCQDPGDALESAADRWSIAKGHDAFYIRGLAGAQKAGLGVYNSEYVVFQPYQILPLYQVDYVLE